VSPRAAQEAQDGETGPAATKAAQIRVRPGKLTKATYKQPMPRLRPPASGTALSKRDRSIQERLQQQGEQYQGMPAVYSSIREHLKSLNTSACNRFHKVRAPDPLEPTTDVCLDNLPKQDCVAYSFGIDNKWFVDDFLLSKNCSVFSYDPSMNQRKFIRHKKPLNLFQPIGIDAKGGKHMGKSTLYTRNTGYEVMTLSQMMEKNGHTHINVLRMDVEAAEWDILEEWTEHGMWDKIDQLLLEIHMFGNPSKEAGERYLSILKKIPFKLFKLQANMHSPQQLVVPGLTSVYEMGYLDTSATPPGRLLLSLVRPV
jgi:FkbM family methyltransferase